MAQATQATATPQVAIRLSLDRSGSRERGKEAVIPGINGFIAKMQKDPSAKGTHFTLVVWDSQGFDTVRRGMMADIKSLEAGEFVPRALTPLHDAMMSDIDALEHVSAARKVLVMDTDGLENYSKRFPDPEAVRAKVEEKRREGWVFIYLAANINAWEKAKEVGIPESMAMNYRQSAPMQQSLWQRMRGTAQAHPYATALLAIAGVALAVAAVRSLIGSAFSDEVDKLGFSDEQRNDAMGVDSDWQEAVAEDVVTFEEPLPDIWALPDGLRDLQMALPDDFDPALGTMVDGVQIVEADGDILSQEDVPPAVYSVDPDSEIAGRVVDDPADGQAVDVNLAETPARTPEQAPVLEERVVRTAELDSVFERVTGGGDVAEVETGGGGIDLDDGPRQQNEYTYTYPVSVEINLGYLAYRRGCHVQIDFSPLTWGLSLF